MFAVCNELRLWLHGKGEAEFRDVITVDESCMFLYNSESKQQISQWITSSLPVTKKVKVVRSTENIFLHFFKNVKNRRHQSYTFHTNNYKNSSFNLI